MHQHERLQDLLTIGQAAERLGVHPDTLRNWDRAGRLRAIRHPLNGYRLYSPQALKQLQDLSQQKPIAREERHE